MSRSVRIVAGFAASFLLLAGCTAPTTSAPATSAPATSAPATSAPATDQSVLEACAALSAPMNEAATKMQSAMSELATDPKKAISALKEFQNTFAGLIADVSNPKVKDQGEKALAAMKKLVGTLEAVMEDPSKVGDIQESSTVFEKEMTALGTVCGA